MARDKVSNGLPFMFAMCLMFLGLLGFLWADGARRDAIEAKNQLSRQIVERDARDACKLDLQAQYDNALLNLFLALSSGEGAAVARVDAQLAVQRWSAAKEQCAQPG